MMTIGHREKLGCNTVFNKQFRQYYVKLWSWDGPSEVFKGGTRGLSLYTPALADHGK